ncbi:MAG: YeeE/YedE family protein [Beijerinckiaceae bacterium]
MLERAIEAFGDKVTLALLGLAVGLVFGFFAQRSRFCLRAAAIEFARGTLGPKLSVWLLAFSAALVVTQLLVTNGFLDVSQARQLAAEGSVSGAIIGGLMFGGGMVMTRGCASRLLVVSANGNLRALLSGLVFAVAAQASYRGVLAPAREYLAKLWTVSGGPMRDLGALLGFSTWGKILFAAAWVAAALSVASSNALPWRVWLSAIAVGAAIALGWLATYAVSTGAFDPVAVRSITFSGPSADMLMFVLSPSGKEFDFDHGMIIGVCGGSFMAAALAREVRLEGFRDGQSMRRYIVGAVIMGFGAMLAGGCAVGAGVTGGAIFAVTSWITLVAMWTGAAIMDALLDRKAEMAVAGQNSQPTAVTVQAAVKVADRQALQPAAS